MMFYPIGTPKLNALFMSVESCYLDRQISSVVHTLNPPREKFSVVEHLTLERRNNTRSVEVHMTEREWCKMFRTFSNLKILRDDDEFVEELSRCQRVDGGGHPV
jgi:hypothetical protein